LQTTLENKSSDVSDVLPHLRREREVLAARCEVLEIQIERMEERLRLDRLHEKKQLQDSAAIAETTAFDVRLTKEEHLALLRQVEEGKMARESRELIRQQLERSLAELEGN
jgi:hypothetical protein